MKERITHLPHHDEGTTDDWRRALGRVHGDGGTLWTDTETKDEAGDEEVPPRVGQALPDTGDEGQERGDKDGAATSEPVVHGRGDGHGHV